MWPWILPIVLLWVQSWWVLYLSKYFETKFDWQNIDHKAIQGLDQFADVKWLCQRIFWNVYTFANSCKQTGWSHWRLLTDLPFTLLCSDLSPSFSYLYPNCSTFILKGNCNTLYTFYSPFVIISPHILELHCCVPNVVQNAYIVYVIT